MGVDFRILRSEHVTGCPYSTFNLFRARVAKAVGCDWSLMGALDSPESQKIRGHGIFPLLNHSDCDGELSTSECQSVGPALREIASGWTNEADDAEQDHKYFALRFADMCDEAAREFGRVEFC